MKKLLLIALLAFSANQALTGDVIIDHSYCDNLGTTIAAQTGKGYAYPANYINCTCNSWEEIAQNYYSLSNHQPMLAKPAVCK